MLFVLHFSDMEGAQKILATMRSVLQYVVLLFVTFTSIIDHIAWKKGSCRGPILLDGAVEQFSKLQALL